MGEVFGSKNFLNKPLPLVRSVGRPSVSSRPWSRSVSSRPSRTSDNDLSSASPSSSPPRRHSNARTTRHHASRRARVKQLHGSVGPVGSNITKAKPPYAPACVSPNPTSQPVLSVFFIRKKFINKKCLRWGLNPRPLDYSGGWYLKRLYQTFAWGDWETGHSSGTCVASRCSPRV